MAVSEEKVRLVRELIEHGLDEHERILYGNASAELPRPAGHPSREVRVQNRTITHCYGECPFFQLDGGPSPMMVCGHPSLKGKGIEECAIISHPDCDNGFPAKCPLMTNGEN